MMFGFSTIKLIGAGLGALAIAVFIWFAFHWKAQAADRAEKLAVICQATRAASEKPKLACGQVALQIQYFGNALRDVKSKTAEAQAADAQHAREVETRQNEASQESSHDYQAELARVRAEYDRLRRRAAEGRTNQGGGGNPPVPGAAPSPGGSDAAATEAGLPPEDALTATEQAIQLKAIQDWAKKVGLAKPQ